MQRRRVLQGIAGTVLGAGALAGATELQSSVTSNDTTPTETATPTHTSTETIVVTDTPTATPSPTAVQTPTLTPTATATPTATPTPTPTATPTPTPTSTPTRTPTPTVTPSGAAIVKASVTWSVDQENVLTADVTLENTGSVAVDCWAITPHLHLRGRSDGRLNHLYYLLEDGGDRGPLRPGEVWSPPEPWTIDLDDYSFGEGDIVSVEPSGEFERV